MFVWNDVDVLFIYNFDLDLKLILFHRHKSHIFSNIMPLTGAASHSAYQCWKFRMKLPFMSKML